jgi:hypothetical protein
VVGDSVVGGSSGREQQESRDLNMPVVGGSVVGGSVVGGSKSSFQFKLIQLFI